jgi:hypothetical chaperone protein
MPAKPTIYAIDFGTSNSLLAAASADALFGLVPLDPRSPDPSILRSILCFPDEGGLFVGREALQRYLDAGMEGRLLRSIKRHLGSRSFRGTTMRGRLFTAEALVAAVLREMRSRANLHFEADVRRVVLGRPVHFAGDEDALAQGRLEQAARLAGFEEIHFFPEPVAAARAFGAAQDRRELALIGDFGGGTSDFTILRTGRGGLERGDVLAVGGIALAGDALDSAIMRGSVARHFGAEVRYRAPFGSNVLQMPRAIVEHLCSPAHLTILRRQDLSAFLAQVRTGSLKRDDQARLDQLTVLVDHALGFALFEAIEGAKQTLSNSEQTDLAFAYPGIDVREQLTRAAFESSSARDVGEILACLDATLLQAGVGPADLEVVCCTGGTAKVPAIAAGIRARFPQARLETFKSFHSVVDGLAHQAQAIARGEAEAPGSAS